MTLTEQFPHFPENISEITLALIQSAQEEQGLRSTNSVLDQLDYWLKDRAAEFNSLDIDSNYREAIDHVFTLLSEYQENPDYKIAFSLFLDIMLSQGMNIPLMKVTEARTLLENPEIQQQFTQIEKTYQLLDVLESKAVSNIALKDKTKVLMSIKQYNNYKLWLLKNPQITVSNSPTPQADIVG